MHDEYICAGVRTEKESGLLPRLAYYTYKFVISSLFGHVSVELKLNSPSNHVNTLTLRNSRDSS